jgi:hypothetical protein
MLIALFLALFFSGGQDESSAIAQRLSALGDRVAGVVESTEAAEECIRIIAALQAQVEVAEASVNDRAQRFASALADRDATRAEIETLLSELEIERRASRSEVLGLRAQLRDSVTNKEWATLMNP